MKYFINLVIAFFSLAGVVSGQNLVPNPSFENYNGCPANFSSIDYSPNYTAFSTVKDWVSPVQTTPDYFNTCAGTTYRFPGETFGIPYNTIGYQYARTGNGYVGMIVGLFQTVPPMQTTYGEYVTSKLTAPLIAGHHYLVSFYINLAEPGPVQVGGAYNKTGYWGYTTDQFGALLTTTMPQSNGVSPNFYIHQTPDIQNNPGNYIVDTVNWTKVRGLYTATGGEQWITLGNMRSSPLNLQYRGFGGDMNNPFTKPMAYFFLDDVCVIDIGDSTTKRDTSICRNNLPLKLKSFGSIDNNYTFLWNTGDTSSEIIVRDSGTYWVVREGDCVYYTDTIKVNIIDAPHVNIGRDTTICEATPLQIGDFIPDATYKWNNDSITPYIHVSSSGRYVMTVSYGPCVTKDTVMIKAMPNPVINMGGDTSICPLEVITLDAAGEGYHYLWSSGDTTATLSITRSGKYWVQVTSQYSCAGSDTILVNDFPLPTVVLGDDTIVCPQTPFVLKPRHLINEDALLWSDGSTGNQISITEGGLYYLNAINRCGATADTIDVTQISCYVLWMPDAFTPNGDGKNDILRMGGDIDLITDFKLSIYNRWGENVFTTNDKYTGWDGTHKGAPCPMGTFVYALQYSIEGKSVFDKGNITLIR